MQVSTETGTFNAKSQWLEAPENDTHPEYVADEYLKAVHSPGKAKLSPSSAWPRYSLIQVRLWNRT